MTATFIPIVLTDTEAVAAAAACAAVATSAPGIVGPSHPVLSAALKIEAARRAKMEANK